MMERPLDLDALPPAAGRRAGASQATAIILHLVLRDEAELEAILQVIAGRPTYVIGVSAPLEVLEERERAREDRGAGMAREQAGHAAYARPYDLVIDTSTCG